MQPPPPVRGRAEQHLRVRGLGAQRAQDLVVAGGADPAPRSRRLVEGRLQAVPEQAGARRRHVVAAGRDSQRLQVGSDQGCQQRPASVVHHLREAAVGHARDEPQLRGRPLLEPLLHQQTDRDERDDSGHGAGRHGVRGVPVRPGRNEVREREQREEPDTAGQRPQEPPPGAPIRVAHPSALLGRRGEHTAVIGGESAGRHGEGGYLARTAEWLLRWSNSEVSAPTLLRAHARDLPRVIVRVEMLLVARRLYRYHDL